jgi:hypothetical protein
MNEYSSLKHLDNRQTPTGNETHVVKAAQKSPVSFLVYLVFPFADLCLFN